MGYVIVIFEVLVWLLITAILAWFKYQFLDLINKLPLEWQLKERLLAHRAGKGIKFLERNWMHECIRIHHRHLCLVLQITIFAILETNLTKYFVAVSTSAHYSRQPYKTKANAALKLINKFFLCFISNQQVVQIKNNIFESKLLPSSLIPIEYYLIKFYSINIKHSLQWFFFRPLHLFNGILPRSRFWF